MFRLLHSFNQLSWPLDPVIFDNIDIQNPDHLDWLVNENVYIKRMKAGRVVKLSRNNDSAGNGPDGTALDSSNPWRHYAITVASVNVSDPIGIITVDANYAGYYNKPGVASRRITVVPITPGVVFETDEWSGGTFADGKNIGLTANGQLSFLGGSTLGWAYEPLFPSKHIEDEYKPGGTNKVIQVYCVER